VTTVLPTYVGSAATSWQLVDWQTPSWSSQPAAAGVARIDCDQLDSDELWLIDRAVVSCSSTAKTTLRLYDSGVDVLRLISGSSAGNFDEADYPGALVLRPSSQLVAVWSNADAGAVATLRLQVRQLRRA
jgi:hypothetical protein